MMQRRQLTQAQWLEAVGIDPFWISEAPVSAGVPNSAATSPAKPERVNDSAAKPVIAPPSVSIIEATDWTALEEQIHGCRACGLYQGRKQAVPGTGDRAATWLMVGEAPGAEEDAAGLPFVGKAGKLLDAMLAALNLKREQGVYIANAVKCRPPQNRTPETAEMDACNGFLQQQIALIQPEVIVALGRPAAYAVLGQEASIQSLRGSVHYHERDGRRIPVIVTYHPAYLLRQPPEKWKAWQDLLLAERTLKASQA